MPYSQPYSHIPFILKPASDMVKEAVWSLNATGGGIETYPLCGYLLHSLFLKLTGAQEQKLKCICWEMASRDFDYRYERMERNRYGECSDYKDKCLVYNDLLDRIRMFDENFQVEDATKDTILNDWRATCGQLFEGSLMATHFKKSYEAFKTMIAGIDRSWIMSDTQLLTKQANLSVPAKAYAIANTCGLSLNEIFVKYVYRERNRCAHNTRSYQHNLPSLKGMTADDYKLQNYFLYMAVILLLDGIYIKLFKIYLEKQS